LCEGLVGERCGHDERGVASGATKVEKAALSEDDDTVTIREDEFVNLGLDIVAGCRFHEAIHVNLVIKVTNVTDDGIVLHLGHVLGHDDVLVTSSGDKNVGNLDDGLKSNDGEAFHGCLESADGVNLSDIDDATSSLHGLGATLTDITIAADDGLLASHHDVGSAADTIGKGVLASVQVVELGLGDGVVDVDGGEEKLALECHLLESVNTSGGLFGYTNKASGELGPLGGGLGQLTAEEAENNLELCVCGGVRVGKGTILGVGSLSLDTLVDKEGHVSSVINDEITAVSLGILGPGDGVECALPVLFKGLTLPGENSGSAFTSNGSSSMVLSGKDVARAPPDLGTHGVKSLDENGSLDGHVEGARDTGTLEKLGAVLLAAGHETRHLMLCEFNLLATKVGKGDVSDAVICRGHVEYLN